MTQKRKNFINEKINGFFFALTVTEIYSLNCLVNRHFFFVSKCNEIMQFSKKKIKTYLEKGHANINYNESSFLFKWLDAKLVD